jgi:hypothetical protein
VDSGDGLSSLRLLLIQWTLHGLALEDELILGVEWQCIDVSFELYDMLYASNVRYSLFFLTLYAHFLAPNQRKTTYAIIVSSSFG